MVKSINKDDLELEKIIEGIEATGNSLKIVCHNVRENVEHALFGGEPLPEGCPSRASLGEFGMRRLKKYVDEINSLTRDLENHLAKNYSNKK
jgi:hypothetical protein